MRSSNRYRHPHKNIHTWNLPLVNNFENQWNDTYTQDWKPICWCYKYVFPTFLESIVPESHSKCECAYVLMQVTVPISQVIYKANIFSFFQKHSISVAHTVLIPVLVLSTSLSTSLSTKPSIISRQQAPALGNRHQHWRKKHLVPYTFTSSSIENNNCSKFTYWHHWCLDWQHLVAEEWRTWDQPSSRPVGVWRCIQLGAQCALLQYYYYYKNNSTGQREKTVVYIFL